MDDVKAHKYMALAAAAAAFSKDTSTKVGAIILGSALEVRSLGYNGAPRGCSADEDERGTTRPEKYFWFSHAELNAITNAARVGTPLDRCVLLVTHPPCMDCARAIVQAGITQVYFPQPDADYLSRWSEQYERALRLFKETGVEVHELQERAGLGPAAEAGGLDSGERTGRADPAHGGGSEGSQTPRGEGVRQHEQVSGTLRTPVERGKTIHHVGTESFCGGKQVFSHAGRWYYFDFSPAG